MPYTWSALEDSVEELPLRVKWYELPMNAVDLSSTFLECVLTYDFVYYLRNRTLKGIQTVPALTLDAYLELSEIDLRSMP